MANIEALGGQQGNPGMARPAARAEGAAQLAKSPPAHPVETEQAVMPAQPTQEGQQVRPQGQAVQDLAERLNKRFAPVLGTRMRFSVDEATEELVVQVIEGDTDEVVRQLPPEEVLNRLAALEENKGIIFNGQG
jgi:flagellar protein FlaG